MLWQNPTFSVIWLDLFTIHFSFEKKRIKRIKYLPRVSQTRSYPAKCPLSWQRSEDGMPGGGGGRGEMWAPRCWPWVGSALAGLHSGWTVARSSGRTAGQWCHPSQSLGQQEEGWWSRVREGWNLWSEIRNVGITTSELYVSNNTFTQALLHLNWPQN